MPIQNINAFLAQLAKDPKFQKKVKQDYDAAKKAGKQYGRSVSGPGVGYIAVGMNEDEAMSKVDVIIRRIKASIRNKLPSVPDDMFVVTGPIEMSDGKWRFDVTFKPSAVHRDSLYQTGYPEGLENIVLLYSHGGSPNKGMVYSDQIVVRGRSNKYVKFNPITILPKGFQVPSNPFLINCVAAINTEMRQYGVEVKLNPVYEPR